MTTLSSITATAQHQNYPICLLCTRATPHASRPATASATTLSYLLLHSTGSARPSRPTKAKKSRVTSANSPTVPIKKETPSSPSIHTFQIGGYTVGDENDSGIYGNLDILY